MARYPSRMTEAAAADRPSGAGATSMVRGSCEIRLVVDQVAGLRTGPAPKLHCGQRVALVVRHGQPRLGLIDA